MGPRLGAVLRVVTAGACWALAAIIAKGAFERGVSPGRMAEARVVVALVLLAAILAVARRDLFLPPRGSLGALAAFGLCVALVNGAYYAAIDRVAVGVALSLQYTGPVLLLGWAALGGSHPGRGAWVAAGITLLGAVLVSQAYHGFGSLNGFGVVAGVASAFFFAGYLLTAEAASRRGTDPATVLVWGFVFAAIVWGVVEPWWSWPVAKLGDVHVALAVLGVGIVGTLIPFFLAVGAVRVLTPAATGIAATVEPPFAAAFAWIFLGQHLSAVQLVGGALVVSGVIVAHRLHAGTKEAAPLEVAP
jgi:drug/metabolite transporter (DMT)-like permease